MLTDFTTAPSVSKFTDILPGSRIRAWSDSGFYSRENRRISCVAIPGKSTKRITVNVSGKRYQLTYRRLMKFPKSLLARPAGRAAYHDAENKEFFFDRNRLAFESVYHFYQTSGEFLCPEHIPMDLLLKEMQFFGLLKYIDCKEKKVRNIPNNKYQKVVWELFENPGANLIAQLLNIVMLLLILLSVILLLIETLPQFSNANISSSAENAEHKNQTQVQTNFMSSTMEGEASFALSNQKLFIVEAFCVGCLTLELLVRFIVSPEKLQFIRSVLNIIDFIAILSFYSTLVMLSFSVVIQSAYVRVLRLVYILRLVKIYRLSPTIQVLAKTIHECSTDLLTLVFLILTSNLVFASCGYYFEKDHEDTDFVSIPAACWWALVTMTSVGYGDMVPTTLGGKITGALCAVSGVVIMAPLLPIIVSKYTKIQEKTEFEKLLMGKAINTDDEQDILLHEQDNMETLQEQEDSDLLFAVSVQGRRRSATIH